MAEKNISAPAEQEKDPLIVEFNKPYTFEGKEYKEIDLRGIKKLTVQAACDAQKDLINRQEAAAVMNPDGMVAYAMEIAARATDLPVEFFRMMPMPATRRVQRAFMNYINVEQSEGAVMKFDAPYIFEGKEYESVDLSGLEDLTCMDLTEAENQISRAGHLLVETGYNYLCCCVLAGKAAKKPTEFFTGLPLCESVKLRNVVNNAGFFE